MSKLEIQQKFVVIDPETEIVFAVANDYYEAKVYKEELDKRVEINDTDKS